jgi:uncharacterized RmlC-like cupin family protein
MRARAVARDGCGRRVRRAGPEPRGTPRRTKAPATRIWLGKLSNEPGHHPVAHHHGEAETAAYVLKGSARIYYGADYRDYVDLEEGDFLFVPPNFPHIESNRSETDELVWLTARSPDNIVVNLLTAGELAHLRQTRTEEAAREHRYVLRRATGDPQGRGGFTDAGQWVAHEVTKASSSAAHR